MSTCLQTMEIKKSEFISICKIFFDLFKIDLFLAGHAGQRGYEEEEGGGGGDIYRIIFLKRNWKATRRKELI